MPTYISKFLNLRGNFIVRIIFNLSMEIFNPKLSIFCFNKTTVGYPTYDFDGFKTIFILSNRLKIYLKCSVCFGKLRLNMTTSSIYILANVLNGFNKLSICRWTYAGLFLKPMTATFHCSLPRWLTIVNLSRSESLTNHWWKNATQFTTVI